MKTLATRLEAIDAQLEAMSDAEHMRFRVCFENQLLRMTQRDAARYRYLRALSYRGHKGNGKGRRYTAELHFVAPQRPDANGDHAFDDFDAAVDHAIASASVDHAAAAVDRAIAAAAVARKQSSRKTKAAGAGRGKSSERHVASCIAPRTVGMITFAEYQRMTQQNWQKLGSMEKKQRHEFQKAQPKACPQCGAQVFDPFRWGVVIHDVTHKIK